MRCFWLHAGLPNRSSGFESRHSYSRVVQRSGHQTLNLGMGVRIPPRARQIGQWCQAVLKTVALSGVQSSILWSAASADSSNGKASGLHPENGGSIPSSATCWRGTQTGKRRSSNLRDRLSVRLRPALLNESFRSSGLHAVELREPGLAAW